MPAHSSHAWDVELQVSHCCSSGEAGQNNSAAYRRGLGIERAAASFDS